MYDFTKGTFRRIYSGELTDKTVNALSMPAELTLHRLRLLADDHGNLHGERDLLLTQTYPRRREVTEDAFAGWMDELQEAGFVVQYEAEGDTYIHIQGWTSDQPAGRNGKRVRRVPASPWDESAEAEAQDSPGNAGTDESGGILVNPGESEIIPDNPGESGAHHYHYHYQDHYQDQDQDHPHHQSKKHQTESSSSSTSSGSGGGGSGEDESGTDGVAGGSGGQSEREQVMQQLERYGVHPSTVSELTMRRDITPRLLDREWADVQSAGNPAGALVARLRAKVLTPGRGAQQQGPRRTTAADRGEYPEPEEDQAATW